MASFIGKIGAIKRGMDAMVSRHAVMMVVVMLGLSSQCGANVLTNPGFETGDFSGWTVDGSRTPSFGVGTAGTLITGTSGGPYTVIVQSGAYAAYAAVAALDPAFQPDGRYLGLAQAVTVQPGIYTVGFSRGTQGSTVGGLGGTRNDVLVNGVTYFFDQGFIANGAYSTVEDQITLSGGLTTFDFHVSGSGSGLAGVSFDNFFVNPVTLFAVPEPASLALLSGVVLLGWLTRWRRTA